ncbi:MAG: insulinase family protein [bacterium]|nr:insulinase family protein [bacterium]
MNLRRSISTLSAVVVLAVALPTTAQDAKVPVQELELDNGLKLLLVERHDNPTVSAGWVARVGSANEPVGVTGIAHLFEHMMFKGSTTVGTTDATAEADLMDELDAIRLLMEGEYSKLRQAKRRGEITGSVYLPENESERLAELRTRMRNVQSKHQALVVKDEFDQIYTEFGASGMNAFTSYDATVYFITVPANKFELWFWMESERLLNPVFREFYSERDVVREERRMRVESDPTAMYEEQFDSMFWGSIPYHHPVIGWPSDVESISRTQAEDFFATFYAPNNLTVAIVGDFAIDEAVKLANTYLGRIPRGAVEPPEMITEEIPQMQERRMHAQADTNPSVQIRWHAVPFVHRDAYALDVLSSVLSGRTGRLYKSLVEDKNIATGEPYASFSAMKYAGSVEIGAQLTEDSDHQDVEAALLAEVEKLKAEPVTDRELQKVKNQSLANSFRRLQSNFFLQLQLLYYDALGNWRYLNESPALIQAVTAEDIMSAANTYFPSIGRNTMWYSRKEGSTGDPDLAALEGQAKAMAKQALAQISSINDPTQLEAMLAQMEAQASQVPEPLKPAFELILKRTQERIMTLQASNDEEE